MTRRQRLRKLAAPLIIAVIVAATTFVTALLFDGERVSQIWVAATLADDGSARVHEVIDYDFGAHQQHGIFRDIPDLDRSVPVEVSSPDAPTHLTITENGDSSSYHVRIGDPAQTISGPHRYDIEYTLTRLGVDGALGWDAVGTDWDVPIDHVEVHVIAAADLSAARCVRGSAGGSDPCTVDQTEVGHLVATLDGLGDDAGVTLYATLGSPLDRAPAEPADPPTLSSGLGLLGLTAIVGALTLLAGLGAAWLIRRAGRDHAPTTGAPGNFASGERINRRELARAVTPSPTLPDTLTPAQGGVLLDGSVLDRHKAAWLTERAVAGEIALERGTGLREAMVVVRLQPGAGTDGGVLDRAFQGRERLPLGVPDREFRRSWAEIDELLRTWRQTSGLWDTATEGRLTRTRRKGAPAGLLGLALAMVGAVLFAHRSGSGLVLAGVGAALAGAGFAAGRWDNYRRALTAQGAAAWLQVEALRQFLARSEQAEIDAIAPDDQSAYTPWAVALGEADHWSLLASSAARSISTSGEGRHDPSDWSYARYGPLFVTSCATTGAAPAMVGASRSSSYSGGGGGRVGGGSGGGGGGSW